MNQYQRLSYARLTRTPVRDPEVERIRLACLARVRAMRALDNLTRQYSATANRGITPNRSNG